MRIPLARRRRSAPHRQRLFPFLERPLHHERWFKRAIFLATSLVIFIILKVIPWGRTVTDSITDSSRRVSLQMLGIAESRSEIDAYWRRFRQRGIADTRPRVGRFYAESSPAQQRLLRYAGLDPEHALLRWANFKATMLFSPKVFEADEGRSYRFRPRTHSIWLKGVGVTAVSSFPTCFLVPDGPGLADALRATGASPIETSRQTTNSWGLRGPEPDCSAPLRGIVLGDSYMQGMFIGDDETPPECLRRYLCDHLKTGVSILNTGVMGYSPEQYYHSLIAFADRFRPQFVVVSVFANDFGGTGELMASGEGDWPEAKYWLSLIAKYCEAHQMTHLMVAAPFNPCLFGPRKSGYYPGKLTNILDLDSALFQDPIDDFLDAHLRWVLEGKRKGKRREGCALFNQSIGDDHFSGAGAAVWADSVGRRLLLLLEEADQLPTIPREAVKKTIPDDGLRIADGYSTLFL